MLPFSQIPASRCPVSNCGFTLIEILVAISILGISLVVVLQLFSGALKSGRVSDQYTRGIFYAQETMEEILLRTELTPGVEEGDFDDNYRWRAEILRIEQVEEEALKLPFDTFQILVDVSWGGVTEGKGKRFQLSTLRVVRKEEASEESVPKKEEVRN
jgi:general secretion pathway protein I